MDPRIRYCVELDRLKHLPGFKRIRAETRFLLIKEFEGRFGVMEKRRLGKSYRRTAAAERFCSQSGLSIRSFFRWSREYKEHGIEGLVPLFGAKNEQPNSRNSTKPFPIRLWVDPRHPLLCLGQLLETLKTHPAIPTSTAKNAVAYLEQELRLLERTSGLSLGRELTQEEILALEAYRTGTHKNHRAKAMILLMAREGRTMQEIARASQRSQRTIYRCLQLFRKEGISFIEVKVNEAGREQVWRERTTRVVDILHGSPGLHSINRTTWTLGAIQLAYRKLHGETLSTGALSRIIKKAGYTWRHARKVLTSPDPEYLEKVARIIEVLQRLKVGEAFFFIDEAGPWRVKKYGGKALTPPGVTRVIPDVQESKGSVYLIAALEALTNQVVWRFISGKTSGAVLGLLEMLGERYRGCSRICLTWDALSSHSSKAVNSWIDDANAKGGPSFEVYPLPSNAQFLNVVESTFGNTRRAVIHNSDYASTDEMQAAIARYLEERNAYFQANPRRAGNKIWDKEVFRVEELPGGLYKKM
jgi:transposase